MLEVAAAAVAMAASEWPLDAAAAVVVVF